jgi:hydroxymethylpyrimidine/phosphomethylpyrimidine kinase
MRRDSSRRIFRFMNVALSIAGSDSGGGAGIQADLKTFQSFGVFGTSVITAVTAQNTLGVRAWESVSSRIIRAQIDAVAADLFPKAFKTGMLGTAAAARAVVEGIRGNSLRNYIFDPVMVASSGDRLIEDETLRLMRDDLLPEAILVTPNIHEAGALLGESLKTTADAERAAAKLVREMGARAALVTGGHVAEGDEIIDVLFTDDARLFRGPRIESRHLHGTGCTLSAAITAGVALGEPLEEVVSAAISYVRAAIAAAPGLGSGIGPLGNVAQLPAGAPREERNSITSD